VAAADSSGVCSLSLQVGTSAPIADPSLPPPNSSSWQECQPASWTAAIDTGEYVSGAGQLPVTLQATNAAGLPNAPMSETLNVDNTPVSVSLSTPNRGVLRFSLQVSSLPEADFPFSPSHSKRWIVTVGVPTPSGGGRRRQRASGPRSRAHRHAAKFPPAPPRPPQRLIGTGLRSWVLPFSLSSSSTGKLQP
jgi:hypothetical protein